MTTFDRAFAVVVGEEGGFTANPADPGNWTGGRCNSGQCHGTKFGISAASFPMLSIAALTIDDAKSIYRRSYWDRIHGDELPPPIALLVFDAAVNSGPVHAIRWLQLALEVTPDGVLGPVSIRAAQVESGRGAATLAEYQAQRLLFLAALPTWRTFCGGWTRRVCRLQFEALRIGEGA